MTLRLTLAALSLIAASAAAPATAAVIVPASAVASSQYPGFPATAAIDTSLITDFASNSQGIGTTVLFTLPGQFFLTNVNLYDRTTSGGGNGSYFGGTTDFTTQFSLTYRNAMGAVIGTDTFNKVTPTSPSGPASFYFTGATVNNGSVKVSSLLYTVLASNGPNPGLADINFTGSVPEPTTWAMMLMGFGMVGFGLRSRRKPSVRVTYA